MDGWKTTFLFKCPVFGAMLVSRRVVAFSEDSWIPKLYPTCWKKSWHDDSIHRKFCFVKSSLVSPRFHQTRICLLLFFVGISEKKHGCLCNVSPPFFPHFIFSCCFTFHHLHPSSSLPPPKKWKHEKLANKACSPNPKPLYSSTPHYPALHHPKSFCLHRVHHFCPYWISRGGCWYLGPGETRWVLDGDGHMDGVMVSLGHDFCWWTCFGSCSVVFFGGGHPVFIEDLQVIIVESLVFGEALLVSCYIFCWAAVLEKSPGLQKHAPKVPTKRY